jgi:hypothetical protein
MDFKNVFQIWISNMDFKYGFQKWISKMDFKNGFQLWISKMVISLSYNTVLKTQFKGSVKYSA